MRIFLRIFKKIFFFYFSFPFFFAAFEKVFVLGYSRGGSIFYGGYSPRCSITLERVFFFGVVEYLVYFDIRFFSPFSRDRFRIIILQIIKNCSIFHLTVVTSQEMHLYRYIYILVVN